MAEPTPPSDGIITEPQVPVTSSLDELITKLKGQAEEALARPTKEQLEIERVKGVISYLSELTQREDVLKIIQAITKIRGTQTTVPLLIHTDRGNFAYETLRMNDKGEIEYNESVDSKTPRWTKLTPVKVHEETFILPDGSERAISQSTLQSGILGSEEFIQIVDDTRHTSFSNLITERGWGYNGFKEATKESIEKTFTSALETQATEAFNPAPPSPTV